MKWKSLGFQSTQVTDISVPGAYEIPLAARRCIEMGYDGVIALGAVIRGETSTMIMCAMLWKEAAVSFSFAQANLLYLVFLTTEDEAQAFDRIGGNHGHKGVESAQVLVEMLNLKNQITP